ncbi:hypothetical protein EEC86_12480, partial [Neisseria gonorrhoeae]
MPDCLVAAGFARFVIIDPPFLARDGIKPFLQRLGSAAGLAGSHFFRHFDFSFCFGCLISEAVKVVFAF